MLDKVLSIARGKKRMDLLSKKNPSKGNVKDKNKIREQDSLDSLARLTKLGSRLTITTPFSAKFDYRFYVPRKSV